MLTDKKLLALATKDSVAEIEKWGYNQKSKVDEELEQIQNFSKDLNSRISDCINKMRAGSV